MLGRIVIEDVRPRTPTGRWPAKAVVGEDVAVTAVAFKDGHDLLAARVRLTDPAGGEATTSLTLVDEGLDRWGATIRPAAMGTHTFVVEAWFDRYATWRREVTAKVGAGEDVPTELVEGGLLLVAMARHCEDRDRPLVEAAAATVADTRADLATRLSAGLDDALAAALAGVALPDDVVVGEPLPLWVDRERALFSTWYELFPRSEGGLAATARRVRGLAELGFDVLYLPPIHPIGVTSRKGRNNTLEAAPGDVGSPWAIGGPEGGHTEVHPDLGTESDLVDLVAECRANGMEVALDYALQCSPDHPWVREHPEWFDRRPDGTIEYAENPPNKYQDIYPINFWPVDEGDRAALWEACRNVLRHWVDIGIRCFRVDNPHTKPTAFWAWVIPAIQADHPDVVFLAEAFTRPPVMAKLAEVGFSQTYTSFTWRRTADELVEHVTQLSTAPTADYLRPNFWPTTPDILPHPLRGGPPPAFRMRLLLAATLVPSYGIYSGYELGENEPQSDADEAYLFSEKYELKDRDWDAPHSIAPFIGRVNAIRRAHPALQRLRGTTFHAPASNASLLVYSRADGHGDVVLCVVNLDFLEPVEDTLVLDLAALGVGPAVAYEVTDELTGVTDTWSGAHPHVRLDPESAPGHVFHVKKR